MPSELSHVTIVGAGLIGLSTADALLGRGVGVSLVESRSAPLQGASHANSGMIHPSQSFSWSDLPNSESTDAALFDLAGRSVRLLNERMAELGLDRMKARSPGCHQIFRDQEELLAARARMEALGVRVCDSDKLAERFGLPALFYPEDRSGDAYVYGKALAESVTGRGGRIFTDVDHVGLERDRSGRGRLIAEGLDLPDGPVIVAAGTGSADLLAQVNVDLPLISVRGWAADYQLPTGFDLPAAPVMDVATRSALTVFDDVFRLSGTWGEATVDPLLGRWRQLLTDLLDAAGGPLRIWSGDRPVSPLGRPYISATSRPNLWVNSGHGHMGWTLCAASGELMADMLVSGDTDPRFSLPS